MGVPYRRPHAEFHASGRTSDPDLPAANFTEIVTQAVAFAARPQPRRGPAGRGGIWLVLPLTPITRPENTATRHIATPST